MMKNAHSKDNLYLEINDVDISLAFVGGRFMGQSNLESKVK